jgi:TatD DNase family protein
MLVDTHIHLDAREFEESRDLVMQNARNAGVRVFVVPAVAPANFSALDRLAATHRDVAPAFGVHPMYVDAQKDDALDAVRARLTQGGAVAVGEIGLDFYVAGLNRERMERFYIRQLELARDFDLPVLLHVRRAQDAVLKQLRRYRPRGGIAHAFNGSIQQAEAFIGLGFKLGFGGAMTYAGSQRVRHLAATLPLESIVLETDGPDIPPAWRPQGPSLPEEIGRYAQIIADLRGLELDAVIQQTGANAAAALPGLARCFQTGTDSPQ